MPWALSAYLGLPPGQLDDADVPRVVAAVAELVYGALANEPYRVSKPLLHELVGMYSARRGEYRIVYQIDEAKGEVMIVRVGARRTIYRPT